MIFSGGYGHQQYKCGQCYRWFASVNMLQLHTETEHFNAATASASSSPTHQKLDCHICGKLFKNINTLRNHRSLYHKNKY